MLVNCVAYGGGAGGKSCEYRLDRVPDETWEEGIDGTLNVVFRCTRETIPIFERSGGGWDVEYIVPDKGDWVHAVIQ